MKIYNLILIVLIPLLTNCSSVNDEVAKIERLEKELYSNVESVFDQKIAENLVSSYETYAEANPTDSLTPSYLFKGAEISMGMGSSKKAITLYNRVYTEYPDFAKAPTALFLIGFVHETQNKDLNEAQKYYRIFIAKYPDHNLIDDAKFSLDNLGKSDEDIIKQFEANLAKAKQDTV